MSFYDTIRDMYKEGIDTRTGFSTEEQSHLDALLELLKLKAMEATQKGQYQFEYVIYSNNTMGYSIYSKGKKTPVNESDLMAFLSNYWYKEKQQMAIQSFLMEELGKEFIFSVEFDLARARRYARLKLSWPLPSDNNSVNIKE